MFQYERQSLVRLKIVIGTFPWTDFWNVGNRRGVDWIYDPATHTLWCTGEYSYSTGNYKHPYVVKPLDWLPEVRNNITTLECPL